MRSNVYKQITIMFRLTATVFKNLVDSKSIALPLTRDHDSSHKLLTGSVAIHDKLPRSMDLQLRPGNLPHQFGNTKQLKHYIYLHINEHFCNTVILI